MNLESLVKDACSDWAEEARVPGGLADRALKGRVRRQSSRIVGATVALAAAVAAGVMVVPMLTESSVGDHAPADAAAGPRKMSPTPKVETDLTTGLPQRLIAAGDTAMSSYYTVKRVTDAAGKYIWYVYNPSSRRYVKTSWAWLAVAPGLRQAVVIEGPLPSTRVGLLDTSTQQVTRWLTVDKPVAGAAWSPDGRKLVLTSYAENPDDMNNQPGGMDTGVRTGFFMVDATTGAGSFHSLPHDARNMNLRQDLEWSRDGKSLLMGTTEMGKPNIFYSLDGKPLAASGQEGYYSEYEAGVSPDGTLTTTYTDPDQPPVAATFSPEDLQRMQDEAAEEDKGPEVFVSDARTGKQVAVLPVQQARVWVGNSHLIAIACDPDNCSGANEFRSRLVLVGLDGKMTSLSSNLRSKAGEWSPVFTRR